MLGLNQIRKDNYRSMMRSELCASGFKNLKEHRTIIIDLHMEIWRVMIQGLNKWSRAREIIRGIQNH